MGEVRRLQLVDTATGELVEGGVPVYVGGKVRGPYGRRFYMQSQEAIEAWAKDKELVGRPSRVLLYLLSRLEFENFIHLQQVEIAKALDLQPSNVSACMTLLEKKGILIRGPKVGGRSFGWRLNARWGWKGKVHNLRAVHGKRT